MKSYPDVFNAWSSLTALSMLIKNAPMFASYLELFSIVFFILYVSINAKCDAFMFYSTGRKRSISLYGHKKH